MKVLETIFSFKNIILSKFALKGNNYFIKLLDLFNSNAGLGDIAAGVDKNGNQLPMVAPVAIQQGKFIAKQIARVSKGQKLASFKYLDKGSMATIGRNKAIVQVKGIKISGALAWLIWLWLHLFYLLGGRNKIGTMADWTWNYLTFDRGNRHIMDS